MILEIAMLKVKQGMEEQFEIDFKIASTYISSIKGYLKHSLQKCIEEENKYSLMVEWETLENHTVDFRKSSAYLEWKKLLHHYYDPFPIVEHFELVFENKNEAQ